MRTLQFLFFMRGIVPGCDTEYTRQPTPITSPHCSAIRATIPCPSTARAVVVARLRVSADASMWHAATVARVPRRAPTTASATPPRPANATIMRAVVRVSARFTSACVQNGARARLRAPMAMTGTNRRCTASARHRGGHELTRTCASVTHGDRCPSRSLSPICVGLVCTGHFGRPAKGVRRDQSFGARLSMRVLHPTATTTIGHHSGRPTNKERVRLDIEVKCYVLCIRYFADGAARVWSSCARNCAFSAAKARACFSAARARAAMRASDARTRCRWSS